jgi:hypothetical protein
MIQASTLDNVKTLKNYPLQASTLDDLYTSIKTSSFKNLPHSKKSSLWKLIKLYNFEQN